MEDKKDYSRKMFHSSKTITNKEKLKFTENFETIREETKESDPLHKSIQSKESELKNIINILSKQTKDRTPKEIYAVSRYLESSKLAGLNDKESKDDRSVNDILLFCSKFLTYEYLPKDEYLFREGDKGDKFYFIISGSVRIIKSIEKVSMMTPEEYLNHLDEIKNDGYLLNKTLKSNKDSYEIDLKHISDIKEIISILQFRSDIDQTRGQKKTIIRSTIQAEGDIEGNPESLEKSRKLKFNFLRRNSKKEVANKISKFNIDFIDNPHEDKEVKTYTFETVVTINKGNYFGDIALENSSNLRTASVQAEENTHLGSIHINEYKYYILKSKQEIEVKIAEKMLNAFFFKFTNPRVFYINYFSFFTYKESKKGSVLYNDDEEIIFIKEGELEYLFHDNLLRLIKIIQSLCKQMNIKYAFSKHEKSVCDDPKFKKVLSSMRFMKIFIKSSGHTVGMEEFFFVVPKYFQIKVYSKVLKYYSISPQNFRNFLKQEPELAILLKKSSLSKMNTLLERIIDIKNINIDLIGEKENSNKNEMKTEKSVDIFKTSYENKAIMHQPSTPNFLFNKTALDLPSIKNNLTSRNKIETPIFKNRASFRMSSNTDNLIQQATPVKSSKYDEKKILLGEINKETPHKISQFDFRTPKKKLTYSFSQSKNNVGFKMVINKEIYPDFLKSKLASFKNIRFTNLNSEIKENRVQIEEMTVPTRRLAKSNTIQNIKIHENSQLKKILTQNQTINNV